MPRTSLGKTIRELRLKAGLTQQQLAERANITMQTLSRLENDKSNPYVPTVEAIAMALGVDSKSLPVESESENQDEQIGDVFKLEDSGPGDTFGELLRFHLALGTRAEANLNDPARPWTIGRFAKAARVESRYLHQWLDITKRYLPDRTKILITSKENTWRGLAQPIEIQPWPKSVGASYLIARTGRLGDRDSAESLSQVLKGLPLAHASAAGFCERSGVSFSEMQERIQVRPKVEVQQTRPGTGVAQGRRALATEEGIPTPEPSAIQFHGDEFGRIGLATGSEKKSTWKAAWARGRTMLRYSSRQQNSLAWAQTDLVACTSQ